MLKHCRRGRADLLLMAAAPNPLALGDAACPGPTPCSWHICKRPERSRARMGLGPGWDVLRSRNNQRVQGSGRAAEDPGQACVASTCCRTVWHLGQLGAEEGCQCKHRGNCCNFAFLCVFFFFLTVSFGDRRKCRCCKTPPLV